MQQGGRRECAVRSLPQLHNRPGSGTKEPFMCQPSSLARPPFCLEAPENGLRPLSKNQVTSRISAIAKQYGLANIKGHSLCIGGTLHYLLKDIPFEVVKVIGRWAGVAFTGYL